MQKYRESFVVSELGRIYAQLPLKEIAEKIRSHFHKTHHQGNTAGGRGGADVPQDLHLTVGWRTDRDALVVASTCRCSAEGS